jgi:soluble lytic murein transglycosylase-like protein
MQQKMSWGLMQIMGFKARELGYEGYLPMLCLPHVGLEWGCRALEGFLKRERGDYFRAVASYNAGSVRYIDGKLVNEEYVLKVAKYAQELAGPPVIVNRG